MSAANQNHDHDSEVVDLNETEQLGALRAITGGNATGIAALAKRLTGLCDLLELELEDAPGAELYLGDAKTAAAQIAALAERLTIAAAAPVESLEPIDLRKLVVAANDRLSGIGSPGYQLAPAPDASTVIHGDLFLLQQSLLTLPSLFPDDRAVTVDLAAATLPGGAAVALALGAPAADVLAEAVPLFEQPADDASRDLLAKLAGLASVHGGKAVALKGARAYAILFPQAYADAAGYDSDANAIRGNETVLLVDDENMIWDVVIDMLQSLGYTVILAGNGRECVEIYRENPGAIDLVLLDMIMPEMNGREAFFALKEIDPKVRVLLQSGYVAEEEARDVLDSGAAGFLRKPYRMVDLAARIRELMK